jgi:hypothetical protein
MVDEYVAQLQLRRISGIKTMTTYYCGSARVTKTLLATFQSYRSSSARLLQLLMAVGGRLAC